MTVAPVDSLGMWEAVCGLPEQVGTAAAAARAVALPNGGAVSNVVVLGSGADGVAGDVVHAAIAADIAVPVVVVKGDDLPAFVDEGTLAFALSWSGDCSGTVRHAREAAARGASLVAITGAGPLCDVAAELGVPHLRVPATIPAARVAVGALTVPVLVVLERMGFVDGVGPRIAAAVDQLRQRRDELSGRAGEARDIARRIGRTFPLVHGSDGVTAVAAQHWKAQVNQNAKSPAFWSAHPEVAHDELAGWGQSGDVTRQLLTLVQLRADGEDRGIGRRFDAEAEILREVVADVVPVRGQGTTPLAVFFDLAMVGDFVSLHLAEAEGVDPGPVPVVSEFARLEAEGA